MKILFKSFDWFKIVPRGEALFLTAKHYPQEHDVTVVPAECQEKGKI